MLSCPQKTRGIRICGLHPGMSGADSAGRRGAEVLGASSHKSTVALPTMSQPSEQKAVQSWRKKKKGEKHTHTHTHNMGIGELGGKDPLLWVVCFWAPLKTTTKRGVFILNTHTYAKCVLTNGLQMVPGCNAHLGASWNPFNRSRYCPLLVVEEWLWKKTWFHPLLVSFHGYSEPSY